MPARGTNAALAPRIAAGDPAAFAVFYEAWFDPTFALARAISRRDESFCLDTVQDVMLKVIHGMPALASEDAVAAWMSKATWSAVIDRIRAERRRERREAGVAASRPEAVPEPWELAFGAERGAWLQQQLAALPATERTLLLERFCGDGTVTEAGARLGLSADAAHGRVRRILARLRKAAAEWFGD